MKKKSHIINFIVLLLTFLLSGCQAIGDIFGAGFYTGIFLVVLIIVIIIVVVVRAGRKN